MGWQRLREATPITAVHMAAVAVHLMAVVSIAGDLDGLLAGVLAALLLVVPMIGAAATLAEYPRVGSGLFLLSFVGTAAAILFAHLGQGYLFRVFEAEAGAGKLFFFASAALLLLVQVKGIIGTLRALRPGRTVVQLVDE